MDEPLSTLSPPKTTAEYKAAIGLLLTKMRRLDAESYRTRAEIERIKAETRSIAARTDATLDRIDAILRPYGPECAYRGTGDGLRA
jgi:hypothetical protein